MRNKGAEIRAKIIARITQETKDRVKKQMTCKWLFNSNECKKEPGTLCNVANCKKWEINEELK